jgi:hypothetical protein
MLLLAIAFFAAQQSQNPSPMVEHTRVHPRLNESHPPGRREKLELGALFLPASWKPRSNQPLLIFFHGGTWIPEVAAAQQSMAVIAVQAGAGSATYAKLFDDPARFDRLIHEAETKAGVTFGGIWLGGWSAGYGAIREILKSPEAYARVPAVLLIDGMHTGYLGEKPGPRESKLDPAPLEGWVKLARDAVAGRKRFVITHSEIFPGTFASTTETADYLLTQLQLTARPVLKWGPMGLQQLSETLAGQLLVIGYAGNSAPDHIDQLNSLPVFLKWLKR